MTKYFFISMVCMIVVSGAARAERVIHYGKDYVVYGHDAASPRPERRPSPGRPMMTIDAYRLNVYLNFDGAPLTQGGNDATSNTTDLITVPSLSYPALDWTTFGGKEAGMKAVVDELKILFMNYAVEWVTTRPASGDYTMAMIGGDGSNCSGGGAAVGISPLDCKNSRKNEIVLIFGAKLAGSTKQLAYVIAHELGHSFGLEHVTDTKSIMAPALSGATCCWTISKLSEAGTCGRTEQDDAAVLKDNLGVGEGDTIPPKVWFVHPGAGAVLPPNFSFEVAAADDLRIHHVEIFLDGVKKLELYKPPFASSVTNLADGPHVLQAKAYDWKPNEVTVEAKVTVNSQCVKDGTCYVGEAGIGNECAVAADCASGLCVKKDGVGRCSETCDTQTKICPEGTSCESVADAFLCTAGTGWSLEKASGGCTIGGERGALPLLGLLLIGLLLIARRRR
jgi:hypothetical protein